MQNDLHTLFMDQNLGDRAQAGFDLAINFLADYTMLHETLGAFSAPGPEGDGENNPKTTQSTDQSNHPIEPTTHEPETTTPENNNPETSGGCGQSFSADTLVATPKGEQAISSLQVGDQVQAYDPQTHQESTQTVQQVWINHDTDLLDVTLQVIDTPTSQSNEQPLENTVSIHHLPTSIACAEEKNLTESQVSDGKKTTVPTGVTQDETIHTTASHPWLTADHGWVRAGMLTAGEPVIRPMES